MTPPPREARAPHPAAAPTVAPTAARAAAPTVAVIGSGIAGLTAAYVLARERRVTLYEAEDRLGGHAHTHLVGAADTPVDSGFLVHNPANYPLLVRLFTELGVRTRPCEMSLSVGCEGCGLRYVSGSTLRTVPERPAGLDRATWRRALTEKARFSAAARRALAEPEPEPEPGAEPGTGTGTAPGTDPVTDPGTDRGTDRGTTLTLGEFIEKEGHDDYFVRHLVLPLVCAVWSCGPRAALRYPARYLFRFLAQHGLLDGGPATRWRTVVGGSADYVRRIAARVPEIRAGSAVTALTRTARGVEVTDAHGRGARYDQAVLATHPAQALALLTDATRPEREVFGAIGYLPSEVLLHTDARLLPDDERDRASWNHHQLRCAADDHEVSTSYHLNRLHGLPADPDYVVTLNAAVPPAPGSVLARMRYEHPLYSPGMLDARRRLPALSTPVLAYAGAYHGWGFHEDGCRSGVAAARTLGVDW
ncbi:FAD-dependent oxidoreductase [Streptomyces sp. NPDC093252]|uniref:NAD(P)/FAD-dependent oxidoreductase n=1 Tax=Streptomyces sp. NPDC093252 TaxID=3154980 RepID=UPI00342F3F5A